MQFAQLPPAGVLSGLGRVRVFLVFKPESEPVDSAALRNHSCCRICQNVLVGVEDDQVDRLVQNAQHGIWFPHREEVVAGPRHYLERRLDLVEIELRRSPDPLLESFAEWRTADKRRRLPLKFTLVGIDGRYVLQVTA